MQKVIGISLSGHPAMFQSDEAAYEVLRRYFERARLRLKDDPDHEEVIRDLEQSIGEKLAELARAGVHVVGVAHINAVLEETGAVDVEAGSHFSTAPDQPADGRVRRRLYRIQEGQSIAGVCQGLAAYSGIRVDWVRTIFFLLTLVTGGVFGIVYLVMAFVLPLVQTREEYAAAQRVRPETT